MKTKKHEKNSQGKEGIFHRTMATAIDVCARPMAFFADKREEKNMKGAIQYVLILGVPFAILTTLVNAIIGGKESLTLYGEAIRIVIILQVVLVYLFLFLLFFIEAGLVHIVALLCGGKANYKDTYRAIAYGDTPSLLAGWLPVIGLFMYVYSIYLHSIGIGCFHRLSRWRAAISVLVPVALVLIITGIVLMKGNNLQMTGSIR